MHPDSLIADPAAPDAVPLSRHPVEIVAGDPASGVVLVCDHASNAMPEAYGTLGLPPSELERHIAYDIGARAVTLRMAGRLGAPAVLSTFSRLLIDPNRGTDDPTLVMRLSDGAVVPGNARIGEAEIAARVARFYRPYDEAIAATIDASLKSGIAPVIVSIHSFTPVWKGWPRPWQIGILWDEDARIAPALVAALQATGDIVVGDNEPYRGGLGGDVIDRNATARGLDNALIEVRQDLIVDNAGAIAWGDRLARILAPLLGARHMTSTRITAQA